MTFHKILISLGDMFCLCRNMQIVESCIYSLGIQESAEKKPTV